MLDEGKLFSIKDYDGLLFNVMADQSINVLKHFRDLDSCEEFHKDFGVDKNKALKYMILMYDRESPITKKIADYVKAKQVCADLAGFTYNESGYFDAEVDSLFRCRNKNFNQALIRFLRFFLNDTYTMIVTMREAFYNTQELIMEGDSDLGKKTAIEIAKIRAEVTSKANDIRKSISDLVKEFSLDERSPYFKKDLFQVIDEDARRLPISPEIQARL